MEEMDFVVRRAAYEDIAQIKEISKEAFRMYIEGAGISAFVSPLLEESYEDLKGELDNKCVLVVLLGDLIIGSVRVEIYDDKTAYLSRFGVRREFQSKGIGKLLINAVDKAMKDLGVSNLYLHTASRMLSLVRFYYGRGFYIESTTKDRGYIRALLCKEYEAENTLSSIGAGYEDLAVV